MLAKRTFYRAHTLSFNESSLLPQFEPLVPAASLPRWDTAQDTSLFSLIWRSKRIISKLYML